MFLVSYKPPQSNFNGFYALVVLKCLYNLCMFLTHICHFIYITSELNATIKKKITRSHLRV